MRFTVTGEWDHNRLLQVVVVLYCFFVILLWVTNWMLYFDSMDLTTASVVDHFLGNEEEFRSPRTCLLYTSPSPRDATLSRMPSSA